MDYYDKNADTFIENTLNIDMGEFYKPFESKLPEGANVLDVGCGPGRDLKHFSERGYKAYGLEPSKKLCEFARQYTGCDVTNETVQSFQTNQHFDGIWACASLLHVPKEELGIVLTKLAEMLKSEGSIYLSFKLGDFEGVRNGRFFADYTLESFQDHLPKTLNIVEQWITEDKRPDREENWLNLLLKKAS